MGYMAEMELSINGEVKRVSVDPAMPLLWVLRDFLDLTGTWGYVVPARCTLTVRRFARARLKLGR